MCVGGRRWPLWALSNGKPSFTVTRSALEKDLNATDKDFAEPTWNAWKIGRQLNALVGVLTAPSRRAPDRRDRVYTVCQPALRDYARRYGLTGVTDCDRVGRGGNGQA
ncbi:MAG: hypothetical protein WD773_08965 [Gemmatimonadales bacterium]